MCFKLLQIKNYRELSTWGPLSDPKSPATGTGCGELGGTGEDQNRTAPGLQTNGAANHPDQDPNRFRMAGLAIFSEGDGDFTSAKA